MKTLAIIPARAGSRGVPRKNVRELLGKPVVAYTMEAALAAQRLDHVAVTTDDPYVKAIASEYDLTVIDRPAELAGDTARIDEAMRHCCVEMAERHGFVADAVVLLYANIPVRADGIIDKTVQKLIDTGADSVQTFSPVGKFHPYWLYEVDGDKASVYIPNAVYQRQSLPPVYAIDGAVAAVTLRSLMDSADNPDPHGFWGTDRRAVIQEAHETVDIDTLRDFYLAEAILRETAERKLEMEVLP